MRVYNFQLPYTIGGMYVHFGVDKFRSEGLLEKLPPDLQQRLEAAYGNWADVVITEQECNEIDDETWGVIASELGLNWSDG